MKPKDITTVALITIAWILIGYFVWLKVIKKPENEVTNQSTATVELQSFVFTDEDVNKINSLDSHGEFPLKIDEKVVDTDNPFKAN